MVYGVLADLVVVMHMGFVLFAVLGGILVLKWWWVLWLHVPAVLWAAAIEFGGWICPLTPLENWLRIRAGASEYRGSFVEHYILPILYPGSLTRELQIVLGVFVTMINLGIYGWLLRRVTMKRRLSSSGE